MRWKRALVIIWEISGRLSFTFSNVELASRTERRILKRVIEKESVGVREGQSARLSMWLFLYHSCHCYGAHALVRGCKLQISPLTLLLVSLCLPVQLFYYFSLIYYLLSVFSYLRIMKVGVYKPCTSLYCFIHKWFREIAICSTNKFAILTALSRKSNVTALVGSILRPIYKKITIKQY